MKDLVSVGTYLMMLERKNEQEIRPATPYQLANLKEKMMRKYSTSYTPAKKQRRAA